LKTHEELNSDGCRQQHSIKVVKRILYDSVSLIADIDKKSNSF
jgi:hypothetical protein